MKNSAILLLSLLFIPLSAFKQSDDIYQIFNTKGKSINKEKLLKNIQEADIVFFGELHNDVVGHWFEKEIVASLFEKHGEKLILGCEMFESDDQLVLNEYLAGKMNDSKFESNSRIWPNYKTDYKEILKFAKKNTIPFVATNIPRRYASLVFSGGFEALDELSDEAKSYIAPLPITYDTSVACYNALLHAPMSGHSSENLPKAQAVKDATMAHFILKNLKADSKFFHFNGAYHSNNHEGIVWYLKKAKPELKIVVISSAEQKEIKKLEKENEKLGDYILVVDSSFPKSH